MEVLKSDSEIMPFQEKSDGINLELERLNWYKYVNKVIMSAVSIRLILDILGLSAMISIAPHSQSILVTISSIALSIDFMLTIIFIFASRLKMDSMYYWYFRCSLMSSFVYYHINTNSMTIISILTFILNLHFLWVLALKKVNVFLSKEADEWMYKPGKGKNIPDRLRGIFYMDGNPVNEGIFI